jgi:hypothetical protein
LGFLISLISALVFSIIALYPFTALGSVDSSRVSVLNYATTNVTTSAYVTLVGSTPITVSKLVICDTSGQFLKIATGSAGNEVDIFAFGVDPLVSGCFVLPYYLKAGTRLSIKSVTASATSGVNTLSFIQ